ncbi:DUF4241 domain-containing protein [Actinomycetaceae bacterium L2_0104]
MNPLDFYAMRTGVATQLDGEPATLRVVELGRLRVASGLLEASDPFVTLGDGPVFEVAPGSYEAFVTVADVSAEQDGSHEREAYLSLVLGEGVVSAVEAAASVRGVPEPGEYWGVGVDAGTVAFADHKAIGECMPAESEEINWYDDVFDNGMDTSWFGLMDADEPHEAGKANIVMPLAHNGENVVLTHSGWGDGFYPVVVTKDSDGRTLGIHIDLLVVGAVDPDLLADVDEQEEAGVAADGPVPDFAAGEPVADSSVQGVQLAGGPQTPDMSGTAAGIAGGEPGPGASPHGLDDMFAQGSAWEGPAAGGSTEYGQLPGSNPPVEDVPGKKPGFFARLFGRKRK